MNTQNVNTAAQNPSERWEEGKAQASQSIEKCLVLNNAHLTYADSALLTLLSTPHQSVQGAFTWIHDTGCGWLIRLNTDGERLVWLASRGASGDLCHLLGTVAREADICLFHFDQNAPVQQGFVTHDW
ncbi:DUF5983 family protein [Pantoea sp. GbtcB22]|uniref:DUF5983 family protein n=1 Tax=Pantoea sp. GbtcB22 TaxID=2824767 RepID=UPI001C305FF5|nr:DUF5983 family protein [Pantoea sp. GbtcB22]